MRPLNRLFVCVSADSQNRSTKQNIGTRLYFENEHLKHVPHKKLKGCYKGLIEQAYLIPLSDITELDRWLSIAFTVLDQESVLIRYPSNETYLIYRDGKREYIGEWRQVDKYTAQQHNAYTFDRETQRYFIAS